MRSSFDEACDPGGGRLPRRREVSPLRRQPVRPDVLPPPPEAPWHGRCEPEGRRPPEQHRLAVRVRDDGVPRVGGEQPGGGAGGGLADLLRRRSEAHSDAGLARDRKSTRLNSSHVKISYAVFCLKKTRRY